MKCGKNRSLKMLFSFKKIIVLIIFYFVLIGNLKSQISMNLRECINYAIKNRIEIFKVNNRIEISKSLINNNYFLYFPKLYADINYDFSWGNSLNLSKYKWENSQKQTALLRIGSELLLFNGFRIQNTISESKQISKKEEYSKKQLELNIKIEIINAYFYVLIQKEKIKLCNNFINESLIRLDKIRILVKEGKLSNIDIIEMNCQLDKEKEDLCTAKIEYSASLNKLYSCMSYYGNNEIIIADPVITLENKLTNKTILDLSKYHNPYNDIYKIDSLILNKQLTQIKSFYYPKISIVANLNSRYIRGNLNPMHLSENYDLYSQLKHNLYKNMCLNIAIPLFNRGDIKSKILKKELETKHLYLNKINENKKFVFNLKQMCNKLKLLQVKYKNSQKYTKTLKKIIQIMNLKYLNGRISIMDLILKTQIWKNSRIKSRINYYNISCIKELINCYRNKVF